MLVDMKFYFWEMEKFFGKFDPPVSEVLDPLVGADMYSIYEFHTEGLRWTPADGVYW